MQLIRLLKLILLHAVADSSAEADPATMAASAAAYPAAAADLAAVVNLVVATDPAVVNCHPYLGNTTLCTSNVDHGPAAP